MASNLTSYAAQMYQAGEAYGAWHPITDNVTVNVGYAYNGNNWVLCIRFTAPTPVSALVLHFCTHGSSANNIDTVMRYAFSSKEADAAYVNATSATPGEGTITIEGGQHTVTDKTIKKTLSAGTHYLYIWTNKSTSSANNYQRIRWYSGGDYNSYVQYEELQGAVRIGDGSSYGTYQVNIGNGTSYDLYIPYIGNGTSWGLYSG